MSDKLLCRSAGHVEAEADTIVVLAELADLLDGFVPAEGRSFLKLESPSAIPVSISL